jgi:hypothetical protein
MKKLAVLVLIAGMSIFGANDAFAYAIGGKIIYNNMLDDYATRPNEFDNNLSGGVFFDVGNVVFQTLKFRPGIDWVDLENDSGKWARIYGIHIDWYWFFMEQKSTVSPFIGFGPSLNYYKFEHDRTDENDSDAGIEGFGGVEVHLTGSLYLLAEARFVIHDIADTGTRIFKVCGGVTYYF